MDQLNVLLAALTGFAVSALIGTVKRFEAAVDTAIVGKLGNLTPILATVLSVGLPKVYALLHLTGPIPSGQALAQAPIAVIVAIASREAYQAIFHKALPEGGAS